MHDFMQDLKNRKSYAEYLKIKRAERQALRDAMPKPQTIHERIETWYATLTADQQARAWTMRELGAIILGETPQRIGAALFDLGWTRKRMWRDDRPTARYWLKR